MLNKQLQSQIEQEAEENTSHFKDNNDYQAGYIQGYKDGYEVSGVKYAELWQAAEEKAERYEKALREIIGYNGNGVPHKHEMISIASEALTPKASTDANLKTN